MKALITGSHGLVGSESVKVFAGNGWDVIGVDNDMRSYLFGKDASTSSTGATLREDFLNYKAVKMDIRDTEQMGDLIRDVNPTVIIHTAAQPAHEWSTNNAMEDFSLNAVGTMSMLEAYRHNAPDAVFIHTSSSKVYGDTVNNLPLVELESRFDLPKTDPRYAGMRESDQQLDGAQHSLFGASKAAADIMAREYGTYFGLPINIFRPVCITGPAHKGAKLHGYLSYLANCIGTGREYTVNGYNGKQVRDNIHGHDLAMAFYTVATHKDRIIPGEAYNIGGGRLSNNSMNEAIDQFEELMRRRANVKYSVTTRRGDHKWCIFDSSKFQQRFPEWKIEYDNDRIMDELSRMYR